MANICEKCTHRNVCRYQEPCEECNQFAEEVVRCKDCENWVKCESSLIGEVMCCKGQGSMYIQKAADDFCSCGRKMKG